MTTKAQTKSLPTQNLAFEPYECNCGETFQTQKSKSEHLALYPWHLHIRATKKGFVCRLCKKRYATLNRFVDHWNQESWHSKQAFILGHVKPKRTGRPKVEMRPAERALLRDRIRQDRTKFRLKLGKRAERLILREIDYSVRRLAMFTLVIVGVPDVGKSSVALALAELIRKSFLKRLVKLFEHPEKIPPKIAAVIASQGKFEFYRPKASFNFNVDDTTRQFRKSRLGHTIVQDEDPGLMGKRSGIIKMAIANLLTQMREAGVSLIFCDPEMVEYVKSPNLIIEVVAKSEEGRFCTCIVYDRKKVARGWANIHILDDDHPLMVKYHPAKTANVAKKMQRGGFDSVRIDWQEFKDYCRKAIDFVDELYERGDIDPYRCPIGTLEIAILSSDIPADSYVQIRVVNAVKTYYRKSTSGSDDSEPITIAKGLKFNRLRIIDELEFLRKVADAWPHVLKHRKKRREKPPDKFRGQLHAEAWYLKYKGKMTAKTIGQELAEFHPKRKAVSHAMINNDYDNGGYPAIFATEVSGECGEYAVWNDYFPEYIWTGGQGKPDLAKGNSWINVKVRCEGRKDLAKYVEPWEKAHLASGGDLSLVVVNYDFGKCKIEFHEVTLAEEIPELEPLQS